MSQRGSDLLTNINNYVLSIFCWMVHLRSKLNKLEHVGGRGGPCRACPSWTSLNMSRGGVTLWWGQPESCTGTPLWTDTMTDTHAWKLYLQQLLWRAAKHSRKGNLEWFELWWKLISSLSLHLYFNFLSSDCYMIGLLVLIYKIIRSRSQHSEFSEWNKHTVKIVSLLQEWEKMLNWCDLSLCLSYFWSHFYFHNN